MFSKTTSSLIALATALTLLIIVSPAQAKVSAPSLSKARAVAKSFAPKGSIVAPVTSSLPGTRSVLVEFDTAAYSPGQTTPKTGLLATVAQQYAIVAFYGNGNLAYAVGGPLTDSSHASWNVVAPDGTPIGPEDDRIGILVEAVAAIPNLDSSAVGESARAAANADSAERMIYSMAKLSAVCSKIPATQLWCDNEVWLLAARSLTMIGREPSDTASTAKFDGQHHRYSEGCVPYFTSVGRNKKHWPYGRAVKYSTWLCKTFQKRGLDWQAIAHALLGEWPEMPHDAPHFGGRR